MLASASVPGIGKGKSAGVAILVRAYLGLRLPEHAPMIVVKSRAICAVLDAPGMGAISLYSVYMHECEGLSKDNVDILKEVGVHAQLQGGLFLLGGDNNFEPNVMKDAGLADMVGGTIVCPPKNTPTCRPKGGRPKVYDYFIMAEALARTLAEVYVVGDADIYPHSPAGVRFHGADVDVRHLTFVNPPFLPKVLPYGPVPGSEDWTWAPAWEAAQDALEAAKKEFPEVNGAPLIPFGLNEFTDVGNTSLEGYLQNFLNIPMEKDGKVYDRSQDPEYLAWLKTFREANDKGLLAKDIFIDKRPQMEEKISQGRYFAMLYQRSDLAAQQHALYAKDPNSVYIAVDGPANSNGDGPALAGDSISGWTVTLISKDVKDKERAIQFLTYMISEEGQMDLYMGKEGETYDMVNGKPEFKPEVLDLLNKDRAAFDQQYGASFKYWMLMDTNMSLAWAPPASEPFKQMEDWTKGKTVSYAEFDGISPTGTSAEGVAASKIAQEWGKTLPKLLLAKSDKEFDKIFEGFLKKRDSFGYEKVEKYQQEIYEKNKEKLDAAK